MRIEQFFDQPLAHLSYAILSKEEIALIDPTRNPSIYYEFAAEHQAKIIAVIETHPHADFVSSHLEISKHTGATIYVSKLLGANYPHQTFDDGDTLTIGGCELAAQNTPGHSPDSICIVVKSEDGKEHSVFTGDTLFVGDVGRPDLRENVGNISSKKEELAKAMYQSTRNKLMHLESDTLVYPSHGAGSLCGKNMGDELQSTIGHEIRTNYALQNMSEGEFVSALLDSQPFTPKYFEYNVELNKRGAENFETSTSKIPLVDYVDIDKGILIIDSRISDEFKNGHLHRAINIQLTEEDRFETWLGSIVSPKEKFYLVIDVNQKEHALNRIAKIGYEANCLGLLIHSKDKSEQSASLNVEDFDKNTINYTILDVRNEPEVVEDKKFEGSINIPLPELRERINEIPTNKDIVIHCRTGYRSATALSILERENLEIELFDLGKKILNY